MSAIPRPFTLLSPRAALSPSGSSDAAAINASLTAASSYGGTLVLGIGTFVIDATITIPTGVRLLGQGSLTILDVSTISGTTDIVSVGDRATLAHVKISGDITPLRALGNRVLCGDFSRIDDVWIDSNADGIDLVGTTGVVITRYRATNLRSSTGFSAAIHCGDTDLGGLLTTDAYGSDIIIDSCDRAIECEDGATDCTFENGTITNVSPGASANYTFVLDAHTHTIASGGVTCARITYRNFLLDTTGPVTVQGVSDNRPTDILFENIRILTPWLPTSGYQSIYGYYADRVSFRNIRVSGETGAISTYFANSSRLVFDDVVYRDHSSFSLDLTSTTDVRIRNATFAQGNSGSPTASATFVAGANVNLESVTFDEMRGGNGVYLSSVNSIDWNFLGCHFIADASSPCGRWVNLSGTNVNVIASRFHGSPTTQGVDLQTITGGFVSQNWIETQGIIVRSTSSRILIESDNIIVAGTVSNLSSTSTVDSLIHIKIIGATIGASGSPADRTSVALPAWVTKYTVEAVRARAVTAAGTLALATIDVRTASGGGGASLLSAATALSALSAADTVQSITPATFASVATASTIYLRQTVDSGNAGTIDLELDIRYFA